MRRLIAALTAALLALIATTVSAHETTRSFASVERDGAAVSARLRLAFRDLEVAVWMDEDLDGRITWGEARRRLDAIEAYVLARFGLEAGGPCLLRRSAAGDSVSSGVAYFDLDLEGRCPSADAALTVRSTVFAEIDPDHRQFLRVVGDGAPTSAVLSAESPSVEVSGGGLAGAFGAYFVSGVEHLIGGPDHLVFLLVLILPALGVPGGVRQAALGVIAAVTGFTLAHAVTLTAAASELVRPPTAAVEALIALSILVTALDNVRPFIPAPRTGVAAAFGIIHGFGFASALGALDLSGASLAVALLGFNLGIETAQIVVVLVVMPALWMLGRGRLLLRLGSFGAAAISTWWLWQRAGMALVG